MIAGAMREGPDTFGETTWIRICDEFDPDFARRPVAELDHFREFPTRINMHEREGDRSGKKSFLRKPKHHGRVFADGI